MPPSQTSGTRWSPGSGRVITALRKLIMASIETGHPHCPRAQAHRDVSCALTPLSHVLPFATLVTSTPKLWGSPNSANSYWCYKSPCEITAFLRGILQPRRCRLRAPGYPFATALPFEGPISLPTITFNCTLQPHHKGRAKLLRSPLWKERRTQPSARPHPPCSVLCRQWHGALTFQFSITNPGISRGYQIHCLTSYLLRL